MNSLSFLVGYFVILSINIESNLQNEKLSGLKVFADIKEGFHFVIHHKPILYTNLAMLISIFGTTLFLTMLVIHLKSTIGLDAIRIGYLLSIGGVAAIIGALITNVLKRYYSYKSILFIAGFVGGGSIIAFGLYDSFSWLVIMNALGTISAAIMSPCIVTIRQKLSPDHLLGRIQATSRFMTWILMPFSALVAGILGEHLGTTQTFLIGGTIATLASFIYLHPSLNEV
ncbi:MFS transporter [Virgibacillus salarius]|nr:MFS transporter [Virgibacillus salarius]WBX82316.1 MFS transporter [Virgibacillus salarius]